MVHTSMDVGMYNVSVHGWANIGFRTTCCLPAAFLTTISAEIPSQAACPTDPNSGRGHTMPSSGGVSGIGHSKGDKLIILPGTYTERKNQA